MKRLFQLIIVLGISLNGFSQIKQGTLTLGGSIYGNGYNEKTEDYDPNKYISLGLSPRVGIFVVDNFELRLSPRFSYNKNTYRSSYEIKVNSVALGFDAIKYFGSSPLKPFIGLGFQSGLEWFKSEIVFIDYIDNTSVTNKDYRKTFQNQGSIDLGLAYFINESISINTSLEYTYSIYNETLEQENSDATESKRKRNSIYFKIGFGIFF